MNAINTINKIQQSTQEIIVATLVARPALKYDFPVLPSIIFTEGMANIYEYVNNQIDEYGTVNIGLLLNAIENHEPQFSVNNVLRDANPNLFHEYHELAIDEYKRNFELSAANEMIYAINLGTAKVVELVEMQSSEREMLDEMFVGGGITTKQEDLIEAQKESILKKTKTKFRDLNRYIKGFNVGDYVVVGARTGIGKTTFMLSCILDIAQKGVPAVVMSYEQSKKQLWRLLACVDAGVDRNVVFADEDELKAFTQSQLQDRENDLKKLNKSFERLSEMPLYVYDCKDFGTSIEQAIPFIRSKMKKHECLHFMVDYIQCMDSVINFPNRARELSHVARKLSQLPIIANIHITAFAQINRDSTNASDKRPQLEHFKESGAIEETAAIVILLHRPYYYGIKEDNEGRCLKYIMECAIRKNRTYGRTGTIEIKYNVVSNQYENYDPEQENFANIANAPNDPNAPKSGGATFDLSEPQYNPQIISRAKMAEDEDIPF